MVRIWKYAQAKWGYAIAIAGVALVTAIFAPLAGYANPTIVSLALLLVVLVAATIFGSRPALIASIAGVLSLNFFFLPPLYTFTISDPQNWAAFGAFLATALIAGQLSAYARQRALESESQRQEIVRLYDELKAAFEKASQAEAYRQAEQLKSALLDAVTHDLRTPLTSIKASVTTLVNGARNRNPNDISEVSLSDESHDQLLDLINEETDRLNQFIGGIVDLARIQAGQLDNRKAWIDLVEVIDAALERGRARLASHKIVLRIERDLPAVRIDADAVGEALYTFLDNAAKYSPPGSDIRVSAGRGENETITISVEDKGPGIPPALREKVFDKFFRVSEQDIHTTGSGLGLGLAIARGIAESQGGTAWAEDGEDDFSTRFVFRFPTGDDESNVNGKPESGEPIGDAGKA
jgi:two-component system sensor histidine kinase KdpD